MVMVLSSAEGEDALSSFIRSFVFDPRGIEINGVVCPVFRVVSLIDRSMTEPYSQTFIIPENGSGDFVARWNNEKVDDMVGLRISHRAGVEYVEEGVRVVSHSRTSTSDCRVYHLNDYFLIG